MSQPSRSVIYIENNSDKILQEETNCMITYSKSLKELEDILNDYKVSDQSKPLQEFELSPKYKNIRNRKYPIEIFHNSPTLFEYLENLNDSGIVGNRSKSLNESEIVDNSLTSLNASGIIGNSSTSLNPSGIVSNSSTSLNPSGIVGNSSTSGIVGNSSKSLNESDQSSKYIRIRNRMYPREILINNPTLVDYVKNNNPSLDNKPVQDCKTICTPKCKTLLDHNYCKLSNAIDNNKSIQESLGLQNTKIKHSHEMLIATLEDAKSNLCDHILTQYFLNTYFVSD